MPAKDKTFEDDKKDILKHADARKDISDKNSKSRDQDVSDSNSLSFDRTEAQENLPVIAAGLVHEVKNPLAAIHLHLQLLEGYAAEIKEEDIRKQVSDKVQMIKKEILNLNQMLKEFLRFIRPNLSDKHQDVELNPIVKEVVELIEPQALREGIDFKFLPCKAELYTQVDPVFVKQVMINLVLNSIQAFQESDGNIEDRKLIISTGEADESCFIQVEDNGPGIPDEIQKRIFEPFFSTKENGSGLGLTLAKKMIGEMGGQVKIKSKVKEGTAVTILLPKNALLTDTLNDNKESP